ncbi:carboxylesterase family protein [Enemella sp. A6]|uniref:carboxylesterase family protein n=1 Tax=Enemella sp. A6 TaxID=3440152 RepID=UPI003EBA2809
MPLSHVPDPAVEAHLGLRFARADRYCPSEYVEGGTHAATLSDVPAFPQLPGRLEAAMGSALTRNPQSEDAFFLNVWTPRGAEHLPVLVFIHGGAWTTGAGSAQWHDGTVLAGTGMVVVTLNYRLGALAHLAPEEGVDPTPLALGDIHHALTWVHRNIADFGGDPTRVTLAGHSAGGWYAHVLNLLPQASGLFRRLALLSASARTLWTPEHLTEVSHLARAGLVGSDLRTAPVDEVLAAGLAALKQFPPPFGQPPSAYLPTFSPALPEDLSRAAVPSGHATALYLRTTAAETAAFFYQAPERHITADEVGELFPDCAGSEPYDCLVERTSRELFVRFADEVAGEAAQAGTPVQRAVFDHASTLDGFGAAHTFDLPYQFGNWEAWTDAPMLQGENREAFERRSAPLVRELHDFVTAEATAR